MKNKFTVIVTAATIALSTTLLTPMPAHAATKTVTIEVGDWWCKIGNLRRGYVASNIIDVVPGNNPAAQWRSGRTTTRSIIYSSNGSAVRVAGKILCKTWWGDPGYLANVVAGRWVDWNDNVTYWYV